MKYKIVVRYYGSKRDLESGNYLSECESGFSDLTLSEAQICLGKMSSEDVCGKIRLNLIVVQ